MLEHPADRFAWISKHISGILSLCAFLDASVVTFHIAFNQTAIYVQQGYEAELKLSCVFWHSSLFISSDEIILSHRSQFIYNFSNV